MAKLCENGICTPKGFQASGIHCGIRKNRTKKDLALIYSEVPCNAAATYTLNKVKGAPIGVTKQHLQDGKAQAIICNSGNANTCNANGVEIATQMCALCADALQLASEDIIVASTGVIGEPLSIDPFATHMEELVTKLSYEGGSDACHPNMATMLAFLTSDVAISSEMLDEVVHEVVNDTFNMVSVDGDTSTNDMLCMLANGLAENEVIQEKGAAYAVFKDALMDICTEISRHIAKDGEGASKLLTCQVVHGNDTMTAKKVAKSVITSSLFKAAMFGKDANWGRILCAIGYCDAQFDINCIDVTLQSAYGSMPVCVNGAGCGFDEERAVKLLSEDEIIIFIDMKQGDAKATAWGCDLTYDYVKINGDYRT